MNRRQFLGAVSASLLASPLLAAAATKILPQRKLGRTGIKVPILGFGSGSRFLMYKEDDDAIAALNHAIDLGITYIDTAHSYGNGKSEERVGRVMATRRKEVVLATVTGQVIRTGIFQEKAFTEAFTFKLSLRLLRNPNMAANGRFPTAVGDFKYEITN